MPATSAEPARRGRWRTARRVLLVAFVAVVATLLVRYARGVDWGGVVAALREYRASTLATAAALVVLSYALFGAYDLFGRKLLGHRLGVGTTWAIGATAYAFNLNLGALVGGLGMRARLYTRHGLDAGTTARTIAVSVTTNWLGYLALAGAAFASGLVEPPPSWRVGAGTLRAIGVGMLVAFAAILFACARSTRRTWTVLGRELPVPTLRTALAQSAVSAANWLAIAALMTVLLGGRVPLPTVTAAMLAAAVAALMTHVPAGLGVLEAVLLVLLGDRIPEPQLLAALLAYRALYYLVPLLVAAVAWPVLESRASRSGVPAATG